MFFDKLLFWLSLSDLSDYYVAKFIMLFYVSCSLIESSFVILSVLLTFDRIYTLPFLILCSLLGPHDRFNFLFIPNLISEQNYIFISFFGSEFRYVNLYLEYSRVLLLFLDLLLSNLWSLTLLSYTSVLLAMLWKGLGGFDAIFY